MQIGLEPELQSCDNSGQFWLFTLTTDRDPPPPSTNRNTKQMFIAIFECNIEPEINIPASVNGGWGAPREPVFVQFVWVLMDLPISGRLGAVRDGFGPGIGCALGSSERASDSENAREIANNYLCRHVYFVYRRHAIRYRNDTVGSVNPGYVYSSSQLLGEERRRRGHPHWHGMEFTRARTTQTQHTYKYTNTRTQTQRTMSYDLPISNYWI